QRASDRSDSVCARVSHRPNYCGAGDGRRRTDFVDIGSIGGTGGSMSDDNLLSPIHNFRFQIDFSEDPLTGGPNSSQVSLCSGGCSECSGPEATMEPRVIKEGGRNYGPAQRAGPVTFATVILKRGVTPTRHLWTWFELVTSGSGYAYRLSATITVQDWAGNKVLAWKLEKARPIKFKAGDPNAKGTDVTIEELHLAHEGISRV